MYKSRRAKVSVNDNLGKLRKIRDSIEFMAIWKKEKNEFGDTILIVLRL